MYLAERERDLNARNFINQAYEQFNNPVPESNFNNESSIPEQTELPTQ
eukprot:CAMPEP_0170512844 /NCGR_PEP_ID=MMETSP0208-20121228/67071_1 /TAXON_ID=197538 /ORGANISM="Strombidium inclinatum, Strain S3" /LENGTH=47 /DNA_ID= /DNA_START= /DNA_END= /DNA_ORIENTATION=